MTELAFRIAGTGGRISEVPIVFRDRERGTSKMSGRIVAESMLLVTRWGLRDLFKR
jgi:dolichol-phosphate mannosyltransferase